MAHFRLLDLAQDCRMEIYEWVFAGEMVELDNLTEGLNATGLLRVNRSIRKEASEIFYKRVTFFIATLTMLQAEHALRFKLKSSNLGGIRKLCMPGGDTATAFLRGSFISMAKHFTSLEEINIFVWKSGGLEPSDTAAYMDFSQRIINDHTGNGEAGITDSELTAWLRCAMRSVAKMFEVGINHKKYRVTFLTHFSIEVWPDLVSPSQLLWIASAIITPTKIDVREARVRSLKSWEKALNEILTLRKEETEQEALE